MHIFGAMIEFLFQEDVTFTSYFMGAANFLVAAFTSIFSVVNPLAAMPVFLSLTENDSDDHRRWLAKKAGFYMFLILVIFLFAGTYIMSFFGISLPGIRIAGGLIIMRSAFTMLAPDRPGRKISDEDEKAAKEKDDISFSPLAMPLLSGPGSIAVVIGLATQARSVTDYILTTVAILLVAIISYIVLRIAPWATRFMGKSGMNAMTRMMGFIALAISVQFIINGIARFFGMG